MIQQEHALNLRQMKKVLGGANRDRWIGYLVFLEGMLETNCLSVRFSFHLYIDMIYLNSLNYVYYRFKPYEYIEYDMVYGMLKII